MADAPVGSPEWWLRRLHKALIERRNVVQVTSDYYDGVHNLKFMSQRFRQAFNGQLDAFADNWMRIVADSPEERLNIDGFRVGEEPVADKDAWRIWQANDMDGQSQLAHLASIVNGTAYAIVWTGDDESTPDICVASARDAIVECHPRKHRSRRAGLRVYRDEWGHDQAELFLPDGVHIFRTKAPRQDIEIIDATNTSWDVVEVQPNPLGVVPVVELPNRPSLRMSKQGLYAQSDLCEVIPLQDAANKLFADMLVASEKQALPARWATGLEVPVDPVTNKPVKPEVDTAQLMINESDAGSFGTFPAADLRNFTIALDLIVQHIASISKTPPHYLNASADRLSGESIKAAETGLVEKVHRKQRFYGEGWEEVMRLAGRIANVPALANASQAEVVWADAESRTESQHVDAILKQKDLGVPEEILWEKLGYSPQEIARIKAIKAEEELFAPVPDMLTEPAVPPAGA